jgi:hypothetical protein
MITCRAERGPQPLAAHLARRPRGRVGSGPRLRLPMRGGTPHLELSLNRTASAGVSRGVLTRSIVVVLLLAVGCTRGSDPPASAPPAITDRWVTVARHEVPWTFRTPPGWFVTIERSRPNPDARVGVLTTWIGTAKYRRGWDAGPNSGAGASARLGRGGVSVRIQLLWSPSDRSIRWTLDPSRTFRLRRDGGTHPDRQNPGWTFHERLLCQGRECVSVLVWHGPDASEEALAEARGVTETIRLQSDWIDVRL